MAISIHTIEISSHCLFICNLARLKYGETLDEFARLSALKSAFFVFFIYLFEIVNFESLPAMSQPTNQIKLPKKRFVTPQKRANRQPRPDELAMTHTRPHNKLHARKAWLMPIPGRKVEKVKDESSSCSRAVGVTTNGEREERSRDSRS